jgi:hypothetical protein
LSSLLASTGTVGSTATDIEVLWSNNSIGSIPPSLCRFWTSLKAWSFGQTQLSSIVSTALGDLTPLHRARSLAMLLHFTSRTVDHSTEAIEISALPWPLVSVRYNNRGNSSKQQCHLKHSSSHGRRLSQHAMFASDQHLVLCIRSGRGRFTSCTRAIIFLARFFTLLAFDTTIEARAAVPR